MFLEFPLAGLAPAALVALAGMAIRARREDKRLARPWLFFLLSVSVLLFGAQVLAVQREAYQLGAFLQPASVGTLVALLVHLGATRELWLRRTIWITLPATLTIAALMIYWWIETDPLIPLISGITALTWRAWEWRGRGRRLAYLGLFLLLLTVGSWRLASGFALANGPKWVYFLAGIGGLFVWPVVAVVLAARLVTESIASAQPSNWQAITIRLAVTALLILVIGEQIVTETVWVMAEDSLSVMPCIVSLVATATAMLLAWAATGWRRLAALGFALLVAFTASYAFDLGSWTSPSAMTEARAEQVERAILRYHERKGHYPSRLADLTPLCLWRIPQPMIFRGQTWCYEGGDNYYRLGYVHQPAFGVPPEYVSIRIHASAGEPPKPSWPCDEELESVKSRAPGQ